MTDSPSGGLSLVDKVLGLSFEAAHDEGEIGMSLVGGIEFGHYLTKRAGDITGNVVR